MVYKNNEGNAEIWCDVSEIDSLPKIGIPDFTIAHVSDKDNGVADYVFNPKAAEGGDWVPVIKPADSQVETPDTTPETPDVPEETPDIPEETPDTP